MYEMATLGYHTKTILTSLLVTNKVIKAWLRGWAVDKTQLTQTRAYELSCETVV